MSRVFVRLISFVVAFLLCCFGLLCGVFGALPPFPTSFLDPKKEAKKEYAAAPLLFFLFLFSFFFFSFFSSLFFFYPNIFSSRSIASEVFSIEPKAVILNQPAPFLPNPSPGVPTISASFKSLWKNSQLPIPSGHLNQI